MPTRNPRVNVVVEPLLFGVMCDVAAAEGVSMSMLARDLIREALELREDASLAAFADERSKSFDHNKALSHEETWG